MALADEKARSRWFKEGLEAGKREQDATKEPLTLDAVKKMSSGRLTAPEPTLTSVVARTG